MRRALARVPGRLGCEPHHVLVDGKPLRTLGTVHTAVVKGDSKCYAIACASIVAKVTRDRLMHALAVRYDGYAWERNSGYGTAVHRTALDERGLTPHHRRSFCLDEQVSLRLDAAAPDDPEFPSHGVRA
jgi:ribonuclease HII